MAEIELISKYRERMSILFSFILLTLFNSITPFHLSATEDVPHYLKNTSLTKPLPIVGSIGRSRSQPLSFRRTPQDSTPPIRRTPQDSTPPISRYLFKNFEKMKIEILGILQDKKCYVSKELILEYLKAIHQSKQNLEEYISYIESQLDKIHFNRDLPCRLDSLLNFDQTIPSTVYASSFVYLMQKAKEDVLINIKPHYNINPNKNLILTYAELMVHHSKLIKDMIKKRKLEESEFLRDICLLRYTEKGYWYSKLQRFFSDNSTIISTEDTRHDGSYRSRSNSPSHTDTINHSDESDSYQYFVDINIENKELKELMDQSQKTLEDKLGPSVTNEMILEYIKTNYTLSEDVKKAINHKLEKIEQKNRSIVTSINSISYLKSNSRDDILCAINYTKSTAGILEKHFNKQFTRNFLLATTSFLLPNLIETSPEIDREKYLSDLNIILVILRFYLEDELTSVDSSSSKSSPDSCKSIEINSNTQANSAFCYSQSTPSKNRQKYDNVENSIQKHITPSDRTSDTTSSTSEDSQPRCIICSSPAIYTCYGVNNKSDALLKDSAHYVCGQHISKQNSCCSFFSDPNNEVILCENCSAIKEEEQCCVIS